MSDGDTGWSPEQSAEVARLFEQLAAASPGTAEHRELRDEIVERHLPLVRYFARRFASRNATMEELAQVGAVGLIKAVDRFDAAHGNEFAAYAAPTVMGEIRRYLRDTGWLLRVPRRAQELQGAVAHARDELSQQLGRVPTVSELAVRVGESPEHVVETLDVIRGREAAPLDQIVGAEAAGEPLQHLVAMDDPGFEHAELRADLREAIAVLDQQERRIVLLRFVGGRTQVEIAEAVGVSQMQVSRVLRRSLERMRGVLEHK